MKIQKSRREEETATTPESPAPNTVPITIDSNAVRLPIFAQYPYWLNQSGLPPTARIVYLAIYDRAIALSIQNKQKYCDHQSRIFVIFSNDDLAKHCAMTLSGIKAAKKLLKLKGYIDIEKISGSNAIRIYPRFPANTATYHHAPHPKKSSEKTNSSFELDDYFEAAIEKSLSPEAREAYRRARRK